MSPGYFTQKTQVFLAEDLVESHLEGDEDSIAEVFKYPFSRFEELIKKGELTESRMISALFLVKSYLNKT
jgi:hypothetical protein